MKLAGKILTAGLAIGGTLGAMVLVNKLTISQAGELNTVLTGEEKRYPWKYGDVFYQVKGAREAKPLVLIHSFAPGASSFEWRKNVDVLAENFRVYALDLLGFGLSDRPPISYSAETYIDLIGDFLKEVIGQPALVAAHGLSGAYAVMCAYRRPQLFEKLILVSPAADLLQEPLPDLTHSALRVLLRLPIVGEFAYNVFTSRPAIQGYYDRRGYHNPGLITDQLVEYVFSSAHQENSYYPSASLLGKDLAVDIHEPLARLRVPVVAIWGREEEVPPNESSAAYKQVNPKIETRILDRSSQQLQDEQATKFNALVRELASAPITQ
ncbi:MAG TPA: alpha/beta fold hydrolase [Ktedonobacteraceae bacterium]